MPTDEHQEFDAWMQQNLRSLPVPAMTPFRPRAPRRPRARMAAWVSAAGVCATVAALALWSPPALVNDAWAHMDEEQGLQGNFVSDAAPVHASVGLPVARPLPGYVQLAKRCQVGSHAAYHVHTFIDGKGWVTILAFTPGDDIAGTQGQGQWLGRHWVFLTLPSRQTVLLLSDDKGALTDVEHYLST
jgi:hypothetical protein